MPPRRSKGFFQDSARPEDEAARQREVEALLAPRRLLVQDVPADRIRPNPFQARVTFDGLEELRDAILALGFTSRLRVRPDPIDPGFFQLVYGERRLRAARMAGRELIPCEIAEHSDDELVEIGLAENIQRQNLNPLEEAQAFATFIRERGYSVRRLAERIGKEKGYVENRMNLLRAPDDVQAMVARRPDTLMAAREIARVEAAEDRAPLIAQVIDGSLSTAGVREIVRDLTSPAPATEPSAAARTVPAAAGLPPPARRPSPSPAPPGAPTSAAGSAERIVRREAAMIRAILERWERLAAEGGEALPALAPAMNDVIERAERVVLVLHAHERVLHDAQRS